MTAAGPTRRDLTFATLDDVVRDAERLLAVGYDKAGTWDLAQVCGHVAEWMRFPIDGYPRVPFLLKPLVWVMKMTIGRRACNEILRTGRLPKGVRTLKETIPPPGGEPAVAVARLKETVQRFQSHTGTFHASPLFGRLNRDEWTRLNLAHAAHHLSFLVPKA